MMVGNLLRAQRSQCPLPPSRLLTGGSSGWRGYPGRLWREEGRLCREIMGEAKWMEKLAVVSGDERTRRGD